jgi:hypothetical protein
MTRLFWNINKFTQFSSVYDTAGNEVRLFGKSIPDQLASLANVVASCHDDVEIQVDSPNYCSLTVPLIKTINTKFANAEKHTCKIIYVNEEDKA